MLEDTKRARAGTRTVTLKAVPFFTQLADTELDTVRSLATEKNYPKNAVVLTEGEMGDSLYMIQSGKVKVFIGDENGREIILKILSPGAFFGEMSMIDKQPRIANLVMRCLAERVREADRKIGTLALMDVYGRVASTLLELAVYNDGKLMVGEKLSQQDLANMVGASREMVNRILKDLSDRGFISIESKEITIVNRELPPSL